MKRAALILLAALLLPVAATADEDAAAYFCSRADKALAEGKPDEAERLFTKALTEADNFPDALLGLALVSQARGEKKTAAARLEACLLECARPPSSSRKRLVRDKAEQALEKLEPARLDYRRVVDDYVGRLIDLAKRMRNSTPDVSRRCCQRILAMRPKHPEAKAMLDDLGPAREASKPEAASKETPLYNGADLTGWLGSPPVWTVVNGVIRGHAPTVANYMRTKDSLEGDYELILECRMTDKLSNTPMLSMSIGMKGVYDCFNLNFFSERVSFSRNLGTDTDIEKLGNVEYFGIPGGFSLQKWHTTRIVVKNDALTLFVNGKKIWEHQAEKGVLDGFLALVVQHSTIEVRKIVRR